MRAEHDFDEMYVGGSPPPWEIGRPQPALAALLERIPIEDPVLDAGCGTGMMAISLAQKGHRVVGIDSSEHGIALARDRLAAANPAAGRELDVVFTVADATRLDDLDLRPRTVIDSGLLHNLEGEPRRAYLAGLRTICAAGSLVCILAISADAGADWSLTGDQLGGLFEEPDWTGSEIEPAEVTALVDGEEIHFPALLLTTRRAGISPR